VITVSALTGGGLATPAVQGYILVILAAALLIGWGRGLVTGLVCVATMLALTYAELAGWLPIYQGVRTPVTYFLVYTLISTLTIVLVYYFTGNIRHALAQANQEIKERRRAEAALRESEARMRVFANATFEGISIAVNERFVEANEQLARMLGVPLAELMGKPIERFIAPEALEHMRDAIRQQNTDPYEVWLMRQDGTRVAAEIRGRPFEYRGQPARLTVVSDLTERKQAEAAREHAQAQLRERIKELTTLHQAAKVLQAEHASVKEALATIVRSIPAGLQYADIAAARIVYDELTFATPTFAPTPWMLRAEFRTPDGKPGLLEIAYQAQPPMEAAGPFLTEELNWVNTLAEMLRTYLSRRQAELNSRRQLERMSALHAIDTAILSSTDLPATLDIVVEQVLSRLHADAVAVHQLNVHMGHLAYAAGSGFQTAAYRDTSQRVGEPLAGTVALTQQRLHIADLAASAEATPRLAQLLAEGFVTYTGVPLLAKGQVMGVLEVFQRTAVPLEAEWLDFLQLLAGQVAVAMDNLELFQELKRSNLGLAVAYDVTLEGWSKALDLRDKETEGHSLRVTNLTLRLAEAMGLPDEDLAAIRQGALLHDVGKLGIPDSILLKPGKLTEPEWDIMRQHPVYAYEWLAPIAYLRRALDIPYCHHEKWDGSGYPRGLTGQAIPLAARLFAIVDVYDALTSDRPYRAAWDHARVRQYLLDESGRHFDPQVVEAFGALLDNPA
jgi:PAS domain S-box-containing protein/putative nucleotidyltransferase with HDIG domain